MLVNILSERHGYTITEDTARDDISSHVDLVAMMMRVGRQAAKVYVTDETISDMADRIANVIHMHNDAIQRGDVADLDARRRLRS